MFLRSNRRKKDGKVHEYWSIVEKRRLQDGRAVQHQLLYLGEISARQHDARSVATDRQGLPPAVEPVVETKSDRAPGGDGHVHPVPVGDLVGGGLGLDAPERAIVKR